MTDELSPTHESLMDGELKACPICEKPAKRNGRTGVGGVICSTPGHHVQIYGASQENADKLWNAIPRTPSPDSGLGDEIDKLCKEYDGYVDGEVLRRDLEKLIVLRQPLAQDAVEACAKVADRHSDDQETTNCCRKTASLIRQEIRALPTDAPQPDMDGVVGALRTKRDYVSDVANGQLAPLDGSTDLRPMAQEDLARIDEALATLEGRHGG